MPISIRHLLTTDQLGPTRTHLPWTPLTMTRKNSMRKTPLRSMHLFSLSLLRRNLPAGVNLTAILIKKIVIMLLLARRPCLPLQPQPRHPAQLRSRQARHHLWSCLLAPLLSMSSSSSNSNNMFRLSNLQRHLWAPHHHLPHLLLRLRPLPTTLRRSQRRRKSRRGLASVWARSLLP